MCSEIFSSLHDPISGTELLSPAVKSAQNVHMVLCESRLLATVFPHYEACRFNIMFRTRISIICIILTYICYSYNTF
jgi:hypothetical protein